MFSRRSSVIIGIPWLIAGLGSVSRGPGMRDRIKAIQRSRQAKDAEASFHDRAGENSLEMLHTAPQNGKIEPDFPTGARKTLFLFDKLSGNLRPRKIQNVVQYGGHTLWR
uniref:Uncharacterized protein n=1 Tax=Coccidioides posadasii RMSCC 3488 TaxID=454284 RepID=A0A0J6ILI1_COCPO|nr:hypothetical protein CPAG_09054 [Coccidioides posadasii RMSCC 3488]